MKPLRTKIEFFPENDKLTWVLLVALITSFFIFERQSWGKFVYLLIAVLIVGVDIFKNRFRLRIRLDEYHLYTLAFALYVLMSSLWAADPKYTFARLSTMLRIFACMYMVYIHYKQTNDKEAIVLALMWSGYILSLYSISFYGLSKIRSIVALGSRLGNEFANVNAIGTMAALSILITITKIIDKKYSVTIIFALPAALMVIATGSKKAILQIAIGLVITVILQTSYEGGKIQNKVAKTIIGLSILFFLLIVVSELDVMKSSMRRMNIFLDMFSSSGTTDYSTLHRMEFIRIGLEQFVKTPIFGIGIGNSPVIIGANTYLHSNYIELLACGGIVGTLIFYAPYLYLLKRLLSVKEKYYSLRVAISMLISQIILDIAQVTYFSKETYIFLMLYCMCLNDSNLKRSVSNYQAK